MNDAERLTGFAKPRLRQRGKSAITALLVALLGGVATPGSGMAASTDSVQLARASCTLSVLAAMPLPGVATPPSRATSSAVIADLPRWRSRGLAKPVSLSASFMASCPPGGVPCTPGLDLLRVQ